MIIYENSFGLWHRGDWRRRVESLLSSDGGYEWESALVSPDEHCGLPVRRKRVTYVGILHSATVETSTGTTVEGSTGESQETEFEFEDADAECNENWEDDWVDSDVDEDM